MSTLPPGLRSLRAFQEAHACAVEVCTAVHALTGGERAILADQLRRAAISLYANIAEGHAKSSRAEQARFYDMALASVTELQAHVLHASTRDILGPDLATHLQTRARHTSRLLTGLLRSARRHLRRPA